MRRKLQIVQKQKEQATRVELKDLLGMRRKQHEERDDEWRAEEKKQQQAEIEVG